MLQKHYMITSGDSNKVDFKDEQQVKEKLIKFERRIADLYEAGKIKAPIHLAYGNEEQVIRIFREVQPEDWVFTSYRSHYHALLKGISEEWLEQQILEGRSMGIANDEFKFYSSAIVPGHLAIAVGTAMGIKHQGLKNKVWAFCGDMAAETGDFHVCQKYAAKNELPIDFVIEDNGWSVDTPTRDAWGSGDYPAANMRYYKYDRNRDGKGYPHHGSGKWVPF